MNIKNTIKLIKRIMMYALSALCAIIFISTVAVIGYHLLFPTKFNIEIFWPGTSAALIFTGIGTFAFLEEAKKVK